MTAPSAPGVATLRMLVARATMAPSPRNSQPWRWIIHPDHVELELDRGEAERATPLESPTWRESVISCGAALLTFRVAAAHALFEAQIDIAPDPHRPELLACVTVVPGTVDATFATLDDVVALRRTAWSAFDDQPLPPGLAGRLSAEAFAEGAELVPIAEPDREGIADLLEHADRDRYSDPRLWPDLAGWVTARWTEDGPEGPGHEPGAGQVAPAGPEFGEYLARRDSALLRQAPFLGVLATVGDTPGDWLAAGQALQRILLVAAEAGVSGGFLNGPCVVEAERARLRALLPGAELPQLVLRLGHPLVRREATARRPVHEVATVHDGPDDADGSPGPADDVDPLTVRDTARDAGSDFTEDTLG